MFGPRRVGPLRLGMNRQQILDTGAASVVRASAHEWPEGCWIVFYRTRRVGLVPHDHIFGIMSRRQGLEQVYATDRMITPEGIRVGSTIAEVRSAYHRPRLRVGYSITLPAARGLVYRIQLTRRVTSMSLERRSLDCTQ